MKIDKVSDKLNEELISNEQLAKDIEKAIKETLVIENKQSSQLRRPVFFYPLHLMKTNDLRRDTPSF